MLSGVFITCAFRYPALGIPSHALSATMCPMGAPGAWMDRHCFWEHNVVGHQVLSMVPMPCRTWITLHELLPSAFKHAGTEKAIISFFVGMALMSGNLYCLELWNEGHSH